jgi:biopolymer transport protein ExbB
MVDRKFRCQETRVETASVATWIVIVEWLARFILVVLLGLSIWSVRVIVEKWLFFKGLRRFDNEAEKTIELLRQEADRQSQAGDVGSWSEAKAVWESAVGSAVNSESPYRRALGRTSGLANAAAFEKVVSSGLMELRKEWERGLPVLGTLGATAPFIGLLGTVMGIIVSFGALSSGTSDTLKIMASLSEALILTAMGLAVAIPAVIANNFFSRQIIEMSRRIESLKELGMALRMKDRV